MLGFSALGTQPLGVTQTQDGLQVTLTTVEAPDIFAASAEVSATVNLALVEAPDIFAATVEAVATVSLATVEEPDIFTAQVTVAAPVPQPALGGGGWVSTKSIRKVEDRLYIDEKADIRALLDKAFHGETPEAEAVVEAVAEFAQDQDDGLQIDWSGLEEAQERLVGLLQALDAYEQHLAAEAALAAAVAHARAMEEQDEDDLLVLMLAV